jgi:hypothetical protein
LRVTAGRFPRATVGRDRLTPIAEAAAVRLTRLTGAGRPESAIPAFAVTVAELPPRELVEQCHPSEVADGALLARHRRTADGALLITLFARPLLLWTDGTGTSLPRLVRQAMAEQLALAVGVQAGDLDPEAD